MASERQRIVGGVSGRRMQLVDVDLVGAQLSSECRWRQEDVEGDPAMLTGRGPIAPPALVARMIIVRLRCSQCPTISSVRPTSPPMGSSRRNRRTWRPLEACPYWWATVSSADDRTSRCQDTSAERVRPVRPNVVLLHGVLLSGISLPVWKHRGRSGGVFLTRRVHRQLTVQNATTAGYAVPWLRPWSSRIAVRSPLRLPVAGGRHRKILAPARTRNLSSEGGSYRARRLTGLEECRVAASLRIVPNEWGVLAKGSGGVRQVILLAHRPHTTLIGDYRCSGDQETDVSNLSSKVATMNAIKARSGS